MSPDKILLPNRRIRLAQLVGLLAGKLLHRGSAHDPGIRLERLGSPLKNVGGIQRRPVVDLNPPINRAKDVSDDIRLFHITNFAIISHGSADLPKTLNPDRPELPRHLLPRVHLPVTLWRTFTKK